MVASALLGKTLTGTNGIKIQYFVDCVSPGNAKADNGCGKKIKQLFDRQLCQKCWCQK